MNTNNLTYKTVSVYEFEAETGVKLTVNDIRHKLAGLVTVGTAMTVNPICKQNAENPAYICYKCYARQELAYKKGLKTNLEKNYEVFSKELKIFPNLSGFKAIRFEGFGDVGNVVQALNYIRIAKANPNVPSAAWTKNPEIWKKAFEIEQKPDNLVIVISSKSMQQSISDEKLLKAFQMRYPFVDKLFRVTSDSTETINCGSRSCAQCMRCYTGGENTIVELIKERTPLISQTEISDMLKPVSKKLRDAGSCITKLKKLSQYTVKADGKTIPTREYIEAIVNCFDENHVFHTDKENSFLIRSGKTVYHIYDRNGQLISPWAV